MKVYFADYFERSIKRLIMASFVLVLLLPIGFFVYSLFQNSWQQVEKRMVEKHHLISEALIKPFSLFFSTRQEALHALGQELRSLDSIQRLNGGSKPFQPENKKLRVYRLLDRYLNSFGNFVALSYVSHPEGTVEYITKFGSRDHEWQRPDYSGLKLSALPVLDGSEGGRDYLSPMFSSLLANKPVILMKHHIVDQNKKNTGVIYAEVSLEQISSMCSLIKFGVKGHCAVVDSAGQLASHPNKKWVQSIKDLSKVSIVKKMLAGESGISEFYSPVLKKDMVAGFSTIPTLGWGIMIVQPKAELTQMLDDARSQTMVWLLIGVFIALITAALLTRKITQPINLLTRLTHKSDGNYVTANLGEAPPNTPGEIMQLWDSFSHLLSGLQHSHTEVQRLNASLKRDIELATAELREKNRQLYEQSTQDYLTSLSNRRYFTEYLSGVLQQEIGEYIGIIMIDVDKFKHLNDCYGHEAGDQALKHLSAILQRSIRPGDLAARLGGDEFIVYIHQASKAVLAECAQNICRCAEQEPLEMEGEQLPFTLSIGTVRQYNTGGLSTKELLRFADQAMYEAKSAGRNQVATYRCKLSAHEKTGAATY
ncbi:MAG: sensor domain-containing diguanylate cyclase [Thiolinea sp.]